jgi:hypothetical protein
MMLGKLAMRLVLVCAALALPGVGFAQEAVLAGTVTDSTGGVLPGVTVTALHEATGNTFVAVTDERGDFRLPVRVGGYQITLELSGFATVTRSGLTLLAGQAVNIPLQMNPSALQETVTVTGEAPLVNLTQTNVSGNIDPQQVAELPVEGRNWMALLLVAPGSRTSSTDANSPLPDRLGADNREYNTNIDGQQVSSALGGGRQPLFSQEMIAEMQFISNRFDATQGRSLGVQVNVISKSGTNRYAGSVRGNFRDDRFNSPNPVLDLVLPISEKQIASTFGGPILQDRLHFFAYQEYDRNPGVGVWNTPYPAFNVTRDNLLTTKQGGVRTDFQISQQLRLMVKGDIWRNWNAGLTGGSAYPASAATTEEHGANLNVQLMSVIGNRAVNEIKTGMSGYTYFNTCHAKWANAYYKDDGPYGPVTECGPAITFTGFSIGGNQGYPRHRGQDRYWVRDDFSLTYEARGRHDLQFGGEFLYHNEESANCTRCRGLFDARGGPRPASDDLQAWFQDPFNVDTWNLDAIAPLVRTFTVGIHKSARDPDTMPIFGGWVQDDWRVNDRLTLNLGMRWDLLWGVFANQGEFKPIMVPGRRQETKDFQPRVGFAYSLNDRTVIRGGSGKYYAELLTPALLFALEPEWVVTVEYPNDGRADFVSNPFNGPKPTYDEALQRFCINNNVPGCLFQSAQELSPPEAYQHTPHTWQNSVGFQRQLGTDMSFEADYVFNAGRNEKVLQGNVNLAYDPATGINLPYRVAANRPYPELGLVSITPFTARHDYHALQATFSKRLSHRWQGAATYSLAGLKSGNGRPLAGVPGTEPIQVPFDVAPDIGGEYSWDATDQRHRLVVNGIWEVYGGFQVSGYHYLGAGNRDTTNYGGDLRNVGRGGEGRLRPDGTIVARNSFIQPAQNRTNVRFQQRISLGSRTQLDLMAEAFNLFNRANYTLETEESAADYGEAIDGQYRTWQFGFRLGF